MVRISVLQMEESGTMLMKVEFNRANTRQGIKVDRAKLDKVGYGGDHIESKVENYYRILAMHRTQSSYWQG